MTTAVKYFLAVPPLIFLGIFYFYPLISIFSLSLMPEGIWDINEFSRLVRTNYYLRVLWFTIWQAGLSTLLTLVLALPGAYVFSRFDLTP